MKKIFDKDKLYFFITKPRFALVISLCIVILGVISILELKQESYPDVTPPQVRVSASYQGASAEVIESTVATVIENQLNGVENMTYMTSESTDGSYSLTLYFKVGTDKNINLFLNLFFQMVYSEKIDITYFIVQRKIEITIVNISPFSIKPPKEISCVCINSG